MACLEQWQIDYWTSRKTQIEADLANISACLTALLTANGVQTYTLSTGQTSQTVSRQGLSGVRALQASLQRELYDILSLLNDGTVGRAIYVRPDF
jgi:N-acetylmuramoyl-L-alanine amidase